MMDPPYTSPRMEARGKTEGSTAVVPREVSVDEEGFVYGSRWVRAGAADAKIRELLAKIERLEATGKPS